MALSKRPFENIEGKGENAGNQHFLFFPQCFQETLFPVVIKSRDCVVKLNIIYYSFCDSFSNVLFFLSSIFLLFYFSLS